jgi:hypothetical protein
MSFLDRITNLFKSDNAPETYVFILKKLRDSLWIINLALIALGGLAAYLIYDLSDNALNLRDQASLNVQEEMVNELNRLKLEVNNYFQLVGKPAAAAETSANTAVDPREQISSTQIHIQRIVEILFRISKQQSLGIKETHDGLTNYIDLLHLALKLIIFGMIGAIVLVDFISIRTFRDMQTMVSDLNSVDVALPPGEASGDSVKFAQAAINKAKSLQQNMQEFEKNYQVGLTNHNLPVVPEPAAAADGPPPPPQAIRFSGPLPVCIQDKQEKLLFQTINYSATGMLLKGKENEPALLLQNQQVKGEVGDKNLQSPFTGVVVRVQKEKGHYLYGVKFINAPW